MKYDKYTSRHIYKNTSTQVHKYTSTLVYKYTIVKKKYSILVHNYTKAQVY